MLREGVINTQREGRGGVCTGSSTLRESFENRFVCISPVKNPFENRFVCISPAKNPFENRFVCTFLVKNPFENRFVCIFPVKDPFENPFGSRFTLCPALIRVDLWSTLIGRHKLSAVHTHVASSHQRSCMPHCTDLQMVCTYTWYL